MRPIATTTRTADEEAAAPRRGRAAPVRVLRVIARLNVGGPAHHVALLGGRLDPERYDAVLVHGSLGPGEASLAGLAAAEGCRLRELPALGPRLDPAADARALLALRALVRELRPDIVETHTAKAGFLGRLAALSVRPRPAIVHTYHGHVLEGYFGPAQTAVYRSLERALARGSDALVAVSQATVDDLVRLRVAPAARFRVLPLGLDLSAFAAPDASAVAAYRTRSGAGPDDLLLGYVGRLVPIKRIDVLLRAFALLCARGVPARLAIAGDGESRGDAERLARDLGVAERVTFHGFVEDVAAATRAADVAVLSSDNEGTPVALIEAGAAGVPAVATAVGGVPEVVRPDTGVLVPAADPAALAAALERVLGDSALRARLGAAARGHVAARFSFERLAADVERLYADLLSLPGERAQPVSNRDHPAFMR